MEPKAAAQSEPGGASQATGSMDDSKKRATVTVTREKLRQHNREERLRRAEQRHHKLEEACQHARAAASVQDAWLDQIEDAPIYTPSAEEWADPLAYIRSIQGEAGQYGICIVRAPLAPTVSGGLAMLLQDPNFKFNTRQQAVRDTAWQDWDSCMFQPGKRYSLREFQDVASLAAAKRFGGLHGCLPARTIEREYWRERERTDGTPLVVEYGNDVEGSLFVGNDVLGCTRWNLNALPIEPGSALRFCRQRPIVGVTTPMLYIGQLFSTFAWHVEDHFMYSINYQHLGAAKTWYGVPASDADGFEAVARRHVYAKACKKLERGGASEAEVWSHVERALMGKTTMFSPRLLLQHNVRVYRAVQQVGDYVVTFPRGYHGGFGNGFQVGEAVNFGMGDWWPFGEDARRRYCRLRYPAILPQEMVLCLDALDLQGRRQQQQQQQGHQQQKEGQQQQKEQQAVGAASGAKQRHSRGRKQTSPLAAAAAAAVAAAATPMDIDGGSGGGGGDSSNPPAAADADAAAGTVARQGAAAEAAAAASRAAEAASDNAVAHTFVGLMRRLNHCRAELEAHGAVALEACPSSDPSPQTCIHCCHCRHLCYVASAVVDPAGEPASWRHLCLDCALTAVTAAAGTAAEAGPEAEAAGESVAAGGDSGGSGSGSAGPPPPPSVLLFVKHCWEGLEECCRELEAGVQELADNPPTLPLDGLTEPERYGRSHEPGWPTPCQPYTWRPVQAPHHHWPAALLQSALVGPQLKGAAGEQPAAAAAAAGVEAGAAEAVGVKGEDGAAEAAAPGAAAATPAAAEAAEAGVQGEPASTPTEAAAGSPPDAEEDQGQGQGLSPQQAFLAAVRRQEADAAETAGGSGEAAAMRGPQATRGPSAPPARPAAAAAGAEAAAGGAKAGKLGSATAAAAAGPAAAAAAAAGGDGGGGGGDADQECASPAAPTSAPGSKEKAAGGGTGAAGAAVRSPAAEKSSWKRGRMIGQPINAADAPLKLVEELKMEVGGGGGGGGGGVTQVNRRVYTDKTGRRRVLVGTEVLEAMREHIGQKGASTRVLGSMLRKAGGKPIRKAHLPGGNLHTAKAIILPRDVRTLLESDGLADDKKELLRQFTAGVWGDEEQPDEPFSGEENDEGEAGEKAEQQQQQEAEEQGQVAPKPTPPLQARPAPQQSPSPMALGEGEAAQQVQQQQAGGQQEGASAGKRAAQRRRQKRQRAAPAAPAAANADAGAGDETAAGGGADATAGLPEGGAAGAGAGASKAAEAGPGPTAGAGAGAPTPRRRGPRQPAKRSPKQKAGGPAAAAAAAAGAGAAGDTAAGGAAAGAAGGPAPKRARLSSSPAPSGGDSSLAPDRATQVQQAAQQPGTHSQLPAWKSMPAAAGGQQGAKLSDSTSQRQQQQQHVAAGGTATRRGNGGSQLTLPADTTTAAAATAAATAAIADGSEALSPASHSRLKIQALMQERWHQQQQQRQQFIRQLPLQRAGLPVSAAGMAAAFALQQQQAVALQQQQAVALQQQQAALLGAGLEAARDVRVVASSGVTVVPSAAQLSASVYGAAAGQHFPLPAPLPLGVVLPPVSQQSSWTFEVLNPSASAPARLDLPPGGSSLMHPNASQGHLQLRHSAPANLLGAAGAGGMLGGMPSMPSYGGRVPTLADAAALNPFQNSSSMPVGGSSGGGGGGGAGAGGGGGGTGGGRASSSVTVSQHWAGGSAGVGSLLLLQQQQQAAAAQQQQQQQVAQQQQQGGWAIHSVEDLCRCVEAGKRGDHGARAAIVDAYRSQRVDWKRLQQLGVPDVMEWMING